MINKHITKKEDVKNMYIGWRLFIEEGLRRGYTFERPDPEQKFYFRASKDGVGFTYDRIPGYHTTKNRDDYPALEKKSVGITMLADAGLPVPHSYGSFKKAADVSFDELRYPVVVKPESSIQSRYAFVDIMSDAAAHRAIQEIMDNAPRTDFVIEKMIRGREFRLTVVNGKYRCAVERRAASVTGDGVHTIAELIAQRNQEPDRGPIDSHLFTNHSLVFDETSEELLAAQNLTIDSVLEDGHFLKIQKKINAAIGTDYVDFTDRVHPSFARMCEKFCAHYNFFMLGFDIICPDITQDLSTQECAFNEFNTLPAIDLNENCNVGTKQPLSSFIWDGLEARGDDIINDRFTAF